MDIISYLLTVEPLTDQRAFELSRSIEPPESTAAGTSDGSQAPMPAAPARPRANSYKTVADRDSSRVDVFHALASKAYIEQVKKRKEASKVGISPPKEVALRRIPSNTRILVRGLVTSPDYNDKHGSVLCFEESTEQYTVALDDGKQLLLKVENIESYSIVMPSTDADASRPRGLSLASGLGAQRVNDVMQQVLESQIREQSTRSLLNPLSP